MHEYAVSSLMDMAYWLSESLIFKISSFKLQNAHLLVIFTKMEHDQLFTDFNVGAALQMSLSTEVRMRAEYNVKEKRRLKSVVERQAKLLKVREGEIENLKVSLWDETNALKERNAILKKERNALDVKMIELEASVAMYENCMDQLEKFQDDQMKVINDKFDKVYTDFVEMTLHLEEKFYPYLLTTIFERRWLLTHGMELVIVNCLNSPEYLSALGVAIGKAIEKDVAAHNPSAEVDYIYALQQLQNVNFSLLAKLKSNKDASVETVMDILRLEGPLTKKLGLNELHPNVDQLMVLIDRSPDQVVVDTTALLLALDVSSVRVRKIRENIANQISALRDVFVPLAEPFSAAVLTGTKGTSNTEAATANTNTALSITFASASSIAPISVDDYEVVGTNDQVVTDENAAFFPNVDDAELNIPQSTSAVLSVGMSISVGMTASVPYVNENRVSSLLDYIMAVGLRMFNRSRVLANT
ncbi:hypothetical protein Tco_0250545 [Tanacetum coccineum]